MPKIHKIKVWDLFVRCFHWALVGSFFIAYFTEDDFMDFHAWAGYLILALLVSRFVWGFIGNQYVRFSDFIYHPKIIKQFLQDTMSFNAKRYIGHNPAGGAMIVLLMICLLITSVTGVIIYEVITPLQFTENWIDRLEGVHEFGANFTLFLVVIHVFGVVFESVIHKENLVASMFHGFKKDYKGDEF